METKNDSFVLLLAYICMEMDGEERKRSCTNRVILFISLTFFINV